MSKAGTNMPQKTHGNHKRCDSYQLYSQRQPRNFEEYMRYRNQNGATTTSTTGIMKTITITEYANQDENNEILPACNIKGTFPEKVVK